MTRDVTAWACSVLSPASGIGPILGQPASGLGPPRSAQRGGAARLLPHRRFDRGCFRRDRSPNRVAWRYPDWTAVGFAIPGPFLGSRPIRCPLPGCSWHAGPDLPVSRGGYPRLGGSLAATLTWIAGGVFFADAQVALSLAADFRRARNRLLRTVFCSGKPDSVVEASSCFAGHIRVRRHAKIYISPAISPKILTNLPLSYPPPRASFGQFSSKPVHNAVDNLICQNPAPPW